MKYTYWTKEEKEQFLLDYLILNKDILIKKYNRNWNNLHAYAYKKGLKRVNNKKVKIKLIKKSQVENIDFFKNIDSNEKAYFYGLILADGTVFGNTLRLNLVEKDRKVVDIFKNTVITDNKIKVINYNSKNKNHQNQISLSITNKEFVDNLKNLGVVENKSKLLGDFYLPRNKLFLSFLRGYFDGDGCISLDKKSATNVKGIFNLVGTKKFLLVIKEELIKILPEDKITITPRFKDRPDTGNQLVVTGNYKIIRLMRQIYENCEDNFLDRKYVKFKELEEHALKNEKLIKRL